MRELLHSFFFQFLLQFIHQLAADFREVIHEVERILNFMCNAGSQFAKGSQFRLVISLSCAFQFFKKLARWW
jgi:hypothetical protein